MVPLSLEAQNYSDNKKSILSPEIMFAGHLERSVRQRARYLTDCQSGYFESKQIKNHQK